jgi:hypothetical protein
MMLELVAIEFLKIRRSLVLLMTLVCPMSVVLIVFTMNLRRMTPADMTEKDWFMLWASVSAMWSWFMLPLYVGLSTSLINGNEHRNQTWRLMLSLPVGRLQLYAAKVLVAVLLMLGAHVALLASTTLAVLAMGAFGFPLAGAFAIEPPSMLWAAPVAALPLLVLQHALSWRLRSVVPPLAVAVIMTFAAIQVGRSDYWPYIPWTYPLIATNAASDAARQGALLLAPATAALLFALTAWWLGRREVT